MEELEKWAEALGSILKDKEEEISMLRKQLLQGKADTVKEYRNSKAFLYKLGGSFTDSFDDYLR